MLFMIPGSTVMQSVSVAYLIDLAGPLSCKVICKL